MVKGKVIYSEKVLVVDQLTIRARRLKLTNQLANFIV